MTPAETAGLTFAEIADYTLRAGPLLAALGVWYFGSCMDRSNKRRAEADERRAEAEKNRHTESMTALKAMQADAAADRKVTQGMLAALQELIRRTSPPSSQAGPQPGPAE